MRKHIMTQAILLTLGAGILTGCGGGGSSGSASNDIPAANLAITEENAQPIAQTAFASDISTINSNLPKIASTGQTGSSSITLKDVALDALNRMRMHTDSKKSGLITAQATSSETATCPYGGTLTYTEVDQDGNPYTVQVGDKVKFTFNGCKESNSLEYNGTQTITLISLTEDSETRLKAGLEIANDLSISNGSNQSSMKGNLQISMDETRACQDCPPTTALIGLKSDKFEITSGSNRYTIYALDYAVYNDYNSRAWWFTQDNILDFNGNVIRIDTTASFDGQGCSYPYQGSAIIYGKNSSVKVTARSGNITNLEIDKNGDGTIDDAKQVGSGEVFSLYCRY